MIKNILRRFAGTQDILKLEEKISALSTQSMNMEQQITGLMKQITDMEEQIQKFKAISPLIEDSNRDIDLIKLDDHYYFMYTSDELYRNWGNHTLARCKASEVEVPRWDQGGTVDLEKLFRTDRPVLELIFLHYWMCGLDFVYCDIGAYIGDTAVPYASFIKKCQKRNQVYSFECGSTFELLEHNIELNGHADIIRAYNLAASNKAGRTLVFREMGHMEHERIYDEFEDREYRQRLKLTSKIAKTIRLDDFASQENLPDCAIVKIDTEGNDWNVISGMPGMLSKPTTVLFEFAPVNLQITVDPQLVLRELVKTFHLFNVPPNHNGGRCEEVTADEIKGFVEKVDTSPDRWTDILCIPRTLPKLDDLLCRLRTSPSQE